MIPPAHAEADDDGTERVNLLNWDGKGAATRLMPPEAPKPPKPRESDDA